MDRLLRHEPDHAGEHVPYEPVVTDLRPFSLRRLLRPHRAALIASILLVVLETVALQAGPLLTQVAIDDGIRHHRRGVIVAVALIYLVSVVVGAVTSRVPDRLDRPGGRAAALRPALPACSPTSSACRSTSSRGRRPVG